MIFEMHFVPISLLLINMYMGDELLRSLEIKGSFGYSLFC